jgi:hypothetical protein
VSWSIGWGPCRGIRGSMSWRVGRGYGWRVSGGRRRGECGRNVVTDAVNGLS